MPRWTLDRVMAVEAWSCDAQQCKGPERRHRPVSRPRRVARGFARASGRPVLDPARRGRVVDPEGRVPTWATIPCRRRGASLRRSSGRRRRTGEPLDLGEIRQKSGKLVSAWALEGDLDATAAYSNTFTLEWPPRSGQTREFPEVDRAEWFRLDGSPARGSTRPSRLYSTSWRRRSREPHQSHRSLHRLRVGPQRALGRRARNARGAAAVRVASRADGAQRRPRSRDARGIPAGAPPSDRRPARAG